MFEESRENTGGVIAGMLRSLEDGHLDIQKRRHCTVLHLKDHF